MQPTLLRQAAFGTQHDGHHGMQPWKQLPKYDTYKSKFGPNYKIAPNFHGISVGRAMGFGMTAAGFGAVAGLFAVFFFSDIPRVRRDIMQNVPLIGEHYIRDVPPEDNPF